MMKPTCLIIRLIFEFVYDSDSLFVKLDKNINNAVYTFYICEDKTYHMHHCAPS